MNSRGAKLLLPSAFLSALKDLAEPAHSDGLECVSRLYEHGIVTLEKLVAAPLSLDLGPDLRSFAYWLMGRTHGSPAALERAFLRLVEGLRDLAVEPRREAALALANWRTKEAALHLIRSLESDPDLMVRALAANALAGRGGLSECALLKSMRDTSELAIVRGAAAEALARARSKRSLLALRFALDDSEAQVRFWAAYALGERGVVGAVRRLRRVAATDLGIVPGWGSVALEAAAALQKKPRRKR